MRMAQQQRAITHSVVDVLVAIHVPLVRAARMRDVRRSNVVVAQVMANASSDRRPRPLKQGTRTRTLVHEPPGQLILLDRCHRRLPARAELGSARRWSRPTAAPTARCSESGWSPVGRRYAWNTRSGIR